MAVYSLKELKFYYLKKHTLLAVVAKKIIKELNSAHDSVNFIEHHQSL